jgi:hypothetical protein
MAWSVEGARGYTTVLPSRRNMRKLLGGYGLHSLTTYGRPFKRQCGIDEETILRESQEMLKEGKRPIKYIRYRVHSHIDPKTLIIFKFKTFRNKGIR